MDRATRWTGRPNSRAARAASPIYAAIRSLGRSGIAEMVERCCEHARRFAELLTAGGRRGDERRGPEPGARPLRRRCPHGSRDRTRRRGRTCFLSGTTMRGKRAMRISVSNWQTSDDDVERSAEAILRAASRLGAAVRVRTFRKEQGRCCHQTWPDSTRAERQPGLGRASSTLPSARSIECTCTPSGSPSRNVRRDRRPTRAVPSGLSSK